MTKKEKAHAIIHGAAASAAATAGALAQGAIFGADTPILTGIHIGMVVALADLFGKEMERAAAVALLGTYAGAGLGVAGAKALLGLIPGLGNAANASVTFAHTEALGWFAYKYFEERC